MNLWLDDERVPPEGVWHWVKNYDQAVRAMRTFRYDWASLDHDLADEHYFHLATTGWPEPEPDLKEKTGYQFALWMAEHKLWPTHGVMIHTHNPVGARNMRAIIDRYGPYDKRCVWVPAKEGRVQRDG